MGGYVALAVLRRHPDRVAGLVLVDTRAGADDAAALDRRRTAAARADAGDIAAGQDAVAPLIAAGTADDITGRARGYRRCGARGDRRLGSAGDGRPAGFHRTAGRDRGTGAGGGGGARRRHAARGGQADGGRWRRRPNWSNCPASAT